MLTDTNYFPSLSLRAGCLFNSFIPRNDTLWATVILNPRPTEGKDPYSDHIPKAIAPYVIPF